MSTALRHLRALGLHSAKSRLTQKQIDHAFRDAAMKHHPDRQLGAEAKLNAEREFKEICEAKAWLARNIGSLPVPAPAVWAPTPRMNHDTSFIDLKWIHPPLHVKLAVKAAVWLLLLGIAGHDYYKKRVAPAQADPGAGGGNTQAARVEPTTAKCVPDRWQRRGNPHHLLCPPCSRRNFKGPQGRT